MKIAILTLRLYDNYGGILQNYALCRVLKTFGHDVESFRLVKPKSWKMRIKDMLKRILIANEDRKKRNFQYIIHRFIENEIPQTSYAVKSARQFIHDSRIQKYDAYIVGSDQVWRRPYMEFGLNVMFLSFVNAKQKKISYAASFGIDDLSEFSNEEILMIKNYLSAFNAVSVREDAGISICESMGIAAVMVLDPVFLLSVSDYLNIAMHNTLPPAGNMLVYLLDNLNENRSEIMDIAKKHDMNPFFFSTLTSDAAAISVEQWLRFFADAEFVITDSFHACAFSILFNKRFYVLGNYGRGLSRINSLLRLFKLEDRLCNDIKELQKKSFENIDWSNINKQLEKLKKSSITFLVNNLK